MSRVQAEVERILQATDQTHPPVSVEAIAKYLDATLKPSRFSDHLSGLLVIKNGTPTIGFNVTHAKVRQRFSIAHEIGHLVLHRDQEQVFVDKQDLVFHRDSDSASGTVVMEKEANWFAAELLMPIKFLQSAIAGFGNAHLDERRIRSLARQFQVSEQAMVFRLINLELVKPADLGSQP